MHSNTPLLSQGLTLLISELGPAQFHATVGMSNVVHSPPAGINPLQDSIFCDHLSSNLTIIISPLTSPFRSRYYAMVVIRYTDHHHLRFLKFPCRLVFYRLPCCKTPPSSQITEQRRRWCYGEEEEEEKKNRNTTFVARDCRHHRHASVKASRSSRKVKVFFPMPPGASPCSIHTRATSCRY